MICEMCFSDFDGRRKRIRRGEVWCPRCAGYWDWYESLTPEQWRQELAMMDTYAAEAAES